MASMLDADLSSQDEGDEDYDPTKDATGERGEGARQKPAKRSRRQSPAAEAPIAPSGGEGGVREDGASERAAKKARVDALWRQLNSKSTAPGQAQASVAGPGLSGLAAVCRDVSTSRAKASQEVGRADKGFLCGLGGLRKKQGGSQDVLVQASGKDSLQIAKLALAAAKDASMTSTAKQHGMVSIKETRQFGGRTVQISRDVAESSKEADKASQKGQPSTGMDAFLESIDTKKKATVLDKSRSDWKEFKKGDNEVEEELEMHKKSSDQYLEKKAFLEKANLREYEGDRDRRLSSDIRTRGRV